MTQPNYCAAIYKGLYVSAEPDNQAKISSCCVNQTGPATSVIDFHKDVYLINQREEFTKGNRPDSCDFCWRKEDAGLPSGRGNIILNHLFNDPYEVELLTMHYNVAPLCNAKCITCGSHWSSAWAAEDEKFNTVGVGFRSFNHIRKSDPEFNVDFSKLTTVYFNGGEPFLSTDIAKILTKVKEHKGSLSELGIVVNTNCSVMPTKEDVALWNECKSVSLICSVEAIESQFEYIRYPLSWSEISHNVSNFGSLFDKKLTIFIAPNLGVHNALEFHKLVDWVSSLKQSNTNYILNPELTQGNLSFNHASADTKAKMLECIPTGTEFQKLQTFIQNSSNDNNTKWIKYLDTIDYRRKLDWRQTFPILHQISI
jgi:molybdenum cofactor biosynthesis enzyme MoaA